MRRSLFLLKLFECILSFICMVVHMVGFNFLQEPLPHVLIFCGTYFGYFLICLFGVLGVACGSRMALHLEAFTCIVGFVLYTICALITMHFAEIDFHLMFLSDIEESQHRFYHYSRIQSIFSMLTGFLLYVHGILIIDIVVVKGNGVPRKEHMTFEEEDAQALEPLELYYPFAKINNCLYDVLCFHCCPAASMDHPEFIAV